MSIRVARILGRANIGGPARTALLLARRLQQQDVETLLVVGECGRILEIIRYPKHQIRERDSVAKGRRESFDADGESPTRRPQQLVVFLH